jgi:hypothetical protein
MKFHEIKYPNYIIDLVKRLLPLKEQIRFFEDIIIDELKDNIQQLKDFLSTNIGVDPKIGNQYYPSQITFLIGSNRIQIEYLEDATFLKIENDSYIFLKDDKLSDFPKRFMGEKAISGANILQNEQEFKEFLNIVYLTFPNSIIAINKR